MSSPARAVLLFLAVLAGLVAPARTQAQNWRPDRPIRLIIPFPPGGTMDVITRLLAEPAARLLGQPVVPENRPGANGNIGIVATARSAPDGHTIAVCPFGCVTNPALYQPAPFDVARDLTPILTVSEHPMVLIVRNDLPAANIADLVALARRRPGALTFASPGAGSPGHLVGELLRSLSGTDMVHVPYRGSAPAVTDLIAGRTDMYFDVFTNALPHIRSGAVRAVAALTDTRQPWLPELPTAAESGQAGLVIIGNISLVGPAGLPAPVTARLNAEFRRVMGDAAVQDRMIEMGALPAGDTPAEAAAYLARGAARWGPLIRERRITAE